jgi:hypothetical protein
MHKNSIITLNKDLPLHSIKKIKLTLLKIILDKNAVKIVPAANDHACQAGIVEHGSKKSIKNVSKIG